MRPWKTPGAGRILPSGSRRIARGPRAAGSDGTEKETAGCRAPRDWHGPEGLGTQFARPELSGAGSAPSQRVGTAGCGLRRGQGLPAPESLEVPVSSGALPALPGSSLRASRADWRSDNGLVPRLAAPARAPVWVLGVGVCVSVCQWDYVVGWSASQRCNWSL